MSYADHPEGDARRRGGPDGAPLARTPLAATPGAPAPDFPNRTITWVVPGGPGSVLDVAARLISLKLAARLGQGVVVDNRRGAGGAAAAEIMSAVPPTGTSCSSAISPPSPSRRC